MDLTIKKYDLQYEEQWDEFVEQFSINGTFLQTRNFLNYHKAGKFEDCSLLFVYKEKIVAICPACVIYEGKNKVFYSHMGSTYGGIVIGKDMLRVEKIQCIFEKFEEHLRKEGFHKCVLKQTMDILCSYPQSILEYFFYHNNFQEDKELNIYIDFKKFDMDLMNNFSKMKRRNVKKCIQSGFQLKELKAFYEIEEFHKILSENLMKYARKPIHTPEEIMELKERLGDRIEVYGAYLDGKMMAGTMVFIFDKTNSAHTQYLAADPQFKDLNPMTYIYFKMIEKFASRKFRYLSWGIATEHMNKDINYNLANNKEEYGSIHGINRVYTKLLI